MLQLFRPALAAPLARALCLAGAALLWAAPSSSAPDQGTATRAANAGGVVRLLISEFRVGGPGGAEDAFVELFNAGDAPLQVRGWSLKYKGETGRAVSVALPHAAPIPAGGHLLLVGRAYTLAKAATGDGRLPARIAGGLQVRDAGGSLHDAVGPESGAAAFREGKGLGDEAFEEAKEQHAWVRRVADGRQRDTGDNARDFALVSVSETARGQAARIGAPGPENLKSPPQRAPRNLAAAAAPVGLAAAPGAEGGIAVVGRSARRDRTPGGVLQSHGTLELRCRLTNRTGAALKSLAFRVNGITSGSAPEGVADLRVLRAAQPAGGAQGGEARPVGEWEARLREPPAQPLGGGLNSLLRVDLPKDGLAAGATAAVIFTFGVERPGSYRVFLGGDRLSLVFDGHTEGASGDRQAPLAADEGGNGGRATLGTATTDGDGSARGPVQPGSPTASTSALPAPLLAAIVLEGHTEDGETGPEADPPASSARASAGSASAAQGTVRVAFMGAMDPRDAGDAANYTVLVGGAAVTIQEADYTQAGRGVSLVLPEGALRAGDQVTVHWSNIRDAEGRLSSGQFGPVTAR